MSQLPDLVPIYDQTRAAALAANVAADLPQVDIGGYLACIEEMYIWVPYTAGGLVDDIRECQPMIDGEPFPGATGRMHIAVGETVRNIVRNMCPPRDDRFAIYPFKFGKVCRDPLTDTDIKLLPAQKFSVRVTAGATGFAGTGPPFRCIAMARVFKEDADVIKAYSPDGLPYGAGYLDGKTLLDPVTGKETSPIDKTLDITFSNVKYFAGSTQQTIPKINPFWTYAINTGVINPAPEYPFNFTLGNVANAYEDLIFNYTKQVTNKALVVEHIGAFITNNRGRVYVLQDAHKRPGSPESLYYGFVVNAGWPNMLPAGVPGQFQGPQLLDNKMLCWQNNTEFRAFADAGVTIAAAGLELQTRGKFIEL